VTVLDDMLAAGPVVAPPAYDGYTALIVQRSGAAAIAVPADGTAAQLGRAPGDVSVDELVANVRYIAAAVHIPVIADARGVGDVERAVRGFVQAGAAAVVVDDAGAAPDVGVRLIPAAELGTTGTIPAGGWEASADAVRGALEELRAGTAESSFVGLPFEEVTSLLGLDEIYELEQRYATEEEAG
jgi:hypothetical protein